MNFLPVQAFLRGIGLLYQFFLEKYIDRKYILPIYRQADSINRQRTSLGQSWIPIYEDLEVSFQMSTRFCEEPSKIAVRSNAKTSVDEIIICVEAAGYFDGNF